MSKAKVEEIQSDPEDDDEYYDKPIEHLLEDIVSSKLEIVGEDLTPVVQNLKKEFIFRASHLNYLTDEELKTISLPLVIYNCLRVYCRKAPVKEKEVTEMVSGQPHTPSSVDSADPKLDNNSHKVAPTALTKRDEEGSTYDLNSQNISFGLSDTERLLIVNSWKVLTKPDFSPSDGTSSLSNFYDAVWTKWTKLDEFANTMFRSRGFKGRVQHLLRIMGVIIKCAEEPSKGMEQLRSIGVQHCIWGINSQSFASLALAIIEGLDKAHGKEISAELKELWLALITNIGDVIINQYNKIKEGWTDILYKRQGSTWKKSHVKITEDTLTIFKTSEMKKAQERYLFKLITDVSIVSDESIQKYTEFCFFIQIGTVKKYFCVNSARKLDDWVCHITWRIKAFTRINEADGIKGGLKYLTTEEKKKLQPNNLFFKITDRIGKQEVAVRHHLDEQIRKTSEFNLFDSLKHATIVINQQAIIEYVNPASIELTGYSPSELLGKNVKVLMPQKYASQHDRFVSDYLNTGIKKVIGTGRYVSLLRADGKDIPIHLTVTEHTLTGQKLFIGTLSQAKETDSSSEDNLNRPLDSLDEYSLFEHLLHSTIVIDEYGIIKYVNNAMEKFSGFLKSELLGTNVKILMSAEIAPRHDSYIERYIKTRQPTIIGKGRDVDIILRDKSLIKGHLEVTEHSVRGNLRFIGTLTVPKNEYGIMQMINREKQNIAALNVPVIMITDDGLIRDLNRNAEIQFGYSSSRAIGKNVNLLMTKDHAKKHNGYIRSYITTGKSKIIGKGRIVRVKCRNGSIKNCHLNVTVKQDGNFRLFLGMLIVLGIEENQYNENES